MRNRLALVLALIFVSVASADRILDKSFFDDRTHNKITFNVDGEGNTISLGRGGSEVLPEDEYAKQGVKRFYFGYWVHDSAKEVDQLLEEIASAPIYSIMSATFDGPIEIRFDPPVRYFGTWVLQPTDYERISFKAYDAKNKLIETAKFDDDAVDGEILNGGLEYGFLGINASREITRIEVPEGNLALDDLYYAPEPSAALLLLLASAGALRRR